MGKLLENLHLTLLVGLILAIGLLVGFHGSELQSLSSWAAVFVWLHVFFGITWIGLLYYFNFVQIPTMPAIPAELKPGVSRYIAPKALFFFRWAAIATVVTGLIVAYLNGYLVEALEVRPPARLIGIGMWIAIVMAINVWLIIWPNQQRALGLVPADDASKARSARIAMLASRTNTLLSIPMLYAMTTYRWLGG